MNFNTKEEVWKDVEGFKGYYQVSNLGRVKSIERTTVFERNGSLIERRVPPAILKPGESTGYQIVSLYKNKKRKLKYVQRLVAKAFVPNPNNYPMINHKDENKKNNHVTNLEWCTAGYNMDYRGLRSRNAKKRRRAVIGTCLDTGETIEYPSVTSAMKDGYNNIGFVLSGERPHAKNYTWEYK